MKKATSVFWYAIAGCLLLVIWGSFAPNNLEQITAMLTEFISNKFGWYYLLLVLAIISYCIYLMFSNYGKIKLGEENEKPEFSLLSWFAMLFSAGMGIGVVFWSTAEPITYAFINPPEAEKGSEQAINEALQYTFLHWGVSAWAIYGLVGLVLAYFKFHKGYPGLISATLIPLLGEKLMKGPLGKAIDVFATLATVIGVAAALGFGSAQITSGLNFLFDVPKTFLVQLIVLIVTTCLFIISAWSGVGRGIKYLSTTNMGIGSILFLMLLILGPTFYILDLLTQSFGNYIAEFIQMSSRLSPENDGERSWINAWTLFYWAFWISWAPFVGTFIARISRGRTVREFLAGVLIVPTLMCFTIFSIFGASALHVESKGLAVLSDLDIETMTFGMLEQFPLGFVMSIMTIIVIAIFFITSADSATFVLGMLTTDGLFNPPSSVKITWGFAQAGVAAIVLYFGGTQGLQNAVIISGLPFSVIMIMMALSFVKEAKKELYQYSNKKN